MKIENFVIGRVEKNSQLTETQREELTKKVASLKGEEFKKEFNTIIDDKISLSGNCSKSVQLEADKVRLDEKKYEKKQKLALVMTLASVLPAVVVHPAFGAITFLGAVTAYGYYKVADQSEKLALTIENLGKIGRIKE